MSEPVGGTPLPELDALVHAPLRLAAMTLLSQVESAEFTWLKTRLRCSDGNLSAHLSKLEAAGYISVAKGFVERKPRSDYRLTASGRAAYVAYLAALRALLGPGASG
jgi:DNA-binding HxlR family transcriptional regulator